MTAPQADRANHPSPHQADTGLAALLYGLVAAPAAWAIGQLINAGLAQEACIPGTEPLTFPALAHLHLIQASVLVGSLLIGASAAITALGAWKATPNEQAGDHHAMLSIGEVRSRFMAFAGLLTSAGFIVGDLFSIPALIFIPTC